MGSSRRKPGELGFLVLAHFSCIATISSAFATSPLKAIVQQPKGEKSAFLDQHEYPEVQGDAPEVMSEAKQFLARSKAYSEDLGKVAADDAKTAVEAQAAVAAKGASYQLGPSQSNGCAGVGGFMERRDQCEQAAIALGKTFSTKRMSKSIYPTGCYLKEAKKKVYFNEHPDGVGSIGRIPICVVKEAVAAKPAVAAQPASPDTFLWRHLDTFKPPVGLPSRFWDKLCDSKEAILPSVWKEVCTQDPVTFYRRFKVTACSNGKALTAGKPESLGECADLAAADAECSTEFVFIEKTGELKAGVFVEKTPVACTCVKKGELCTTEDKATGTVYVLNPVTTTTTTTTYTATVR